MVYIIFFLNVKNNVSIEINKIYTYIHPITPTRSRRKNTTRKLMTSNITFWSHTCTNLDGFAGRQGKWNWWFFSLLFHFLIFVNEIKLNEWMNWKSRLSEAEGVHIVSVCKLTHILIIQSIMCAIWISLSLELGLYQYIIRNCVNL